MIGRRLGRPAFWCLVFLRWEQLLLLGLDFRYRLPNFPHSPARWRRERQGLALQSLTPDGGRLKPFFFLTSQLVCLGGDHDEPPVMKLQPLLEFQVLFHPAPTRVEYQEAKLQRPSLYKVLFDKPLPLESYVLGDTRISVSRQIDEVELSADLIKINQLRATRRGAGKRQLVCCQSGNSANWTCRRCSFPEMQSPGGIQPETDPAGLHLLQIAHPSGP